MTTPDEERIAELLRALPPAPEAWVKAAQEIPFAREEIDAVVDRAASDAEFRRALAADPEATLEREGYRFEPVVVREIRAQLARLP